MNKKEISVKKIKLGALLYKTRNELGIKQATLQQEGIISQSHLSKIENGEMKRYEDEEVIARVTSDENGIVDFGGIVTYGAGENIYRQA